METFPPVFLRDVAFSAPVTRTMPPAPPPSIIEPLRPDTVPAEIEPGILMASRTAERAVAAVRTTCPPDARNLPALVTRACPSAIVARVGMATCRNWPPLTSSIACSPEPRPMLPSGATITPLLATVPPSSATKPPGPVAIAPLLTTPFDAPAPEKLFRPAMKSLSAKSRVEATKPEPVFTTPPEVIWMPFGLIR